MKAKLADDDADDFYTRSCTANFSNPKVAPFVLEISKETVERAKQRIKAREIERDLLPECPPSIRRSPSSNLLIHLKPVPTGPQLRPQPNSTRVSAMKSTPDLRVKHKRDSKVSLEDDDDPFYLESFISQFPRPPVHEPGAYKSREPVNPRVRRQNSNFSMPTSRAYPDRAQVQPRKVEGRVLKGTVKPLAPSNLARVTMT